ncbi:MAG TPA: winged helix-turn-helix domain-containing protein [Candidatus Dormibacteraeota bacterium]|jgi:DNA-binding response OmpR family regulator
MTEALATKTEATLIEGEDPGTMRAADARRWIEIYSRLIEFKDELLERVRSRTSNNGNDHGNRSGGDLQADEHVVLIEMTRLRGRLAFWQRRHAELAPVDLDDHLGIISPKGNVVPLTRREDQLLRFLLQNPGRYFDTRTLAARAWNDPSLASEQVRTYVVRLRRRLREAEAHCDIHSERRRGYALTFEEVDKARNG